MEELEILRDDYNDDYWVTYSNFFIDENAVEVTEPLVTLDSEGLNSRNNLLSSVPTVSETKVILASDCINDHVVDIVQLLDAYTVHAIKSTHDIASTDIVFNDRISPSDTTHDLTSKSPQLYFAYGTHLFIDDVSHELQSDEMLYITNGEVTLSVKRSDIVLEDNGTTQIIFIRHSSVDAMKSTHVSAVTGELYLSNGDAVYPRSCSNVLASTDIDSYFETQETIFGINKGRHYQKVDDYLRLQLHSSISPENAYHKNVPFVVAWNTLNVSDCFHALSTDMPWNYIDNAEHSLVSETVKKLNYIISDNSFLYVYSETPALEITLNTIHSTIHRLMTKDYMAGVDNSYIEFDSRFIATKNKYRRIEFENISV